MKFVSNLHLYQRPFIFRAIYPWPVKNEQTKKDRLKMINPTSFTLIFSSVNYQQSHSSIHAFPVFQNCSILFHVICSSVFIKPQTVAPSSCSLCRSLPTHVKKVLASEDDPSLMKGKNYNKLQIFMQMDGSFNANIASMDGSMNVYNFYNSHCYS